MPPIPEPYWSDPLTTLYCGDSREIVDYVMHYGPDAPDPKSVLMLTDPPYGVSEQTNRRSKRRSALSRSNNFSSIVGDDRPFDAAFWVRANWRIVMFGANYFAASLPPSASWLVWDKLDGLTSSRRTLGFNDNADVELIWTNLGGPARILRHRWMGIMKGSERGERRVHPTQKPIALMMAILDLFARPGDVVFDPYAGSGPTLLAARALGLRSIGVEIRRGYCETIVKRIERSVHRSTDAG